ncbi:MAG: phenylalanine--tRNA ligase subunit beta [Candidatus Bathyarchaeia archaeon]
MEVNLKDLEDLLNFKLPETREELNKILSYVKGEIEEIKGYEVSIEIKDSNHPDLWCVEGIARALKGFLGLEKGFKVYNVNFSNEVLINVEPEVKHVRPYIAAALIKNVKLTSEVIKGLMHLQDKLDQTYGRKRRKTSIGLYNFDLISPPINYKLAEPEKTSFIPLGFNEKMSLKEILIKHPKGLEYGHIISGFKHWPLLVDSKDKILSMPPIINSNDLGKVTEDTKNILIEVTGTSFKAVSDVLTIMTTSLADRGGKIHSVKIIYPYEDLNEVITPNLTSKNFSLHLSFINNVLGLNLSLNDVIELLSKARYNVKKFEDEEISVEVPCYRIDIMHPIDIVEDIAIAYGYNNIPPRWPLIFTKGGLTTETMFYDLLRELMIGFGLQEILTFSMSNKEKLFTKMNLKPSFVIEVSNPKMSTFTCLRNWLLPGLLEFLSNNKHAEYPQKIFELGECVEVNEENKIEEFMKLACSLAHSKASFSEIKSILVSLLSNLNLTLQLKECLHESFIEGRVGKIVINDVEVGLIGEIHPKVLEEWGLEVPVAAFELNATKLLNLKLPSF